jgi:Cu(I)/Ag(I) efflux system membrane fusion protein
MTSAPTPTGRRWLGSLLTVLVTAGIAGPIGALVGGHSHATLEQASAREQYVCPMHPGVVREHPGACPICGMTLVKAQAADSGQRKPLFYRSPMNAAQTSPVPTRDSMGMDYLPVFEDDAATSVQVEGRAAVTIDASKQQLIGLRTATVDRGPIGASLRLAARVSVDETRVRKVNVKVPGYVEHVFLDFVGKPIRKGQPLFSLYSPELLATENELLMALKGDASLVAAARRKLELWDVPEGELQRLEKEGVAAKAITFVSPATGVVTKKELVEGARLEAGAMPYEVVDLSTVWVLAEVYETDLRFVEPGLPATLHLTAWPDRTYTGKVLFIDPVLDPRTRTARVRLDFANPRGELRPELFGEVTLERPARDVLRVPTDALVQTGERDVVFVARGDGRFEPHLVQTGEAGRDFTEVREGLHEGEAVVTRASFLVDSESSMRASLARLAPDASSAAPMPAGHEGMK